MLLRRFSDTPLPFKAVENQKQQKHQNHIESSGIERNQSHANRVKCIRRIYNMRILLGIPVSDRFHKNRIPFTPYNTFGGLVLLSSCTPSLEGGAGLAGCKRTEVLSVVWVLVENPENSNLRTEGFYQPVFNVDLLIKPLIPEGPYMYSYRFGLSG